MGSLLVARGRALSVCALVAATLAGCTTTGAATSSVPGTALTIYISKPPGQLTVAQQDVISAEQLALREIGSTVGKFTLKAVECPGAQCAGKKLSDTARSAISDPGTIAYIGELVPGSSAQTIGITNAQTVLQVSPTDTAIQLTQAVPEVPESPGKFYESLSANGQTFARVVPNDKLEAKALLSAMQSAGVKRLYVKAEPTDYGAALAGQILGGAGADGITTVGSGPAGADGVLYAGTSPSAAAQLFNSAAASNPSVKLFAPSALADDSFAAMLSRPAQHDAFISSPGYTTGDEPTQARQFVAAFRAAYGHAPATQAIFGYEAMASVLAALRKAGGSANARSTVVKDFLSLTNNSGWPDSAVGSYSIDKSGDITFAGGAPFVLSAVKDGILVPFKAV